MNQFLKDEMIWYMFFVIFFLFFFLKLVPLGKNTVSSFCSCGISGLWSMKRKALVYSETGPIHNSFVNFPIKKSNRGEKPDGAHRWVPLSNAKIVRM